jgi:hypothetical protein
MAAVIHLVLDDPLVAIAAVIETVVEQLLWLYRGHHRKARL